MSDDEPTLVEVVVQSPRRYFGISDFEAIESNAKIRSYAQAISEYTQKHRINVTVREWDQSNETGRLSGLTLQTSGMIGSIKYVPPNKQNKRAAIQIHLQLARVSTNLPNFDQYCTGLTSLVKQFK